MVVYKILHSARRFVSDRLGHSGRFLRTEVLCDDSRHVEFFLYVGKRRRAGARRGDLGSQSKLHERDVGTVFDSRRRDSAQRSIDQAMAPIRHGSAVKQLSDAQLMIFKN
jgi:hypothetical protein